MKKSLVLVDLGFGDSGKGTNTDYYARTGEFDYNIRFNGGSQALHFGETDDGVIHGFSQLGSGMMVKSMKTILSRFVLVNPETFLIEADKFESKFDSIDGRVYVDENCPVITPLNQLFNRLQETVAGVNRKGSCGQGIGVTQQDVDELGPNAIYVKDLVGGSMGFFSKLQPILESKLTLAKLISNSNECWDLIKQMETIDWAYYLEQYDLYLERVQVVSSWEILQMIRNSNNLFEGAQGIMLDQKYGFFPHVTRSNCTFDNAFTLLKEAGYEGEVKKVGILRAYHTRHGHGPFPTESKEIDVEPCYNNSNEWQGNFRHGWFDCVLARYALDVVDGVDVLIITNLDRLGDMPSIKICNSYKTSGALDESGFVVNFDGRTDLTKPENIVRSSARTKLLDGITPVYSEVMLPQGLTGTDYIRFKVYLEVIEELIGKTVDIISVSPSASGKFEIDNERGWNCKVLTFGKSEGRSGKVLTA